MADGELKVDPNDLTTKAATVEGIPWGSDPAAVPLSDPDKLSSTTASVQNLVKNATALGAEQKWGQAESRRLAETLRLVAKAYQDVDEASSSNIDATIPGGASVSAPAPIPIGLNATPPPPVPQPMEPFGYVSDNDGSLDPIQTDKKLAEGDQGASLRAAATEWTANAARLTEAAIPFEVRMQNWEGVAAEAAYTKLKSFGGWLQALAGKWNQLAAEAEKLATAHDQAKAANAPIRIEFEALQSEFVKQGMAASQASRDRLQQLYRESEAVREIYANGGRPTPVQPPQPRPDSVAPTSPVTANGDPRDRGVPARTEDEERRDPWGAGEQPNAQGGGAPSGGEPQQPQTPQEAPVSPPVAEQPPQATQQSGQQESSPAGGQQGGGQQGGAPGGSPGGSPGGGSPGGGMPTTGKGTEPRLPTDPSLKPAAAGGGSSGGGGGGGGVPAGPLQPAVGAETVAPSPARPGAPIPVASAGSGGGGGAMGGGVGGMAPMHGAHGGGAGEKKRNPQLSVDEPLYVEDRPHTEPVIGVRPRRRGTPEDGKRGETS
ncbi:PPE domain-containing protein [Mycolicibacterium sp. PAM1]|uniref:ESX-1 secretion-associated protein EspB PE domain-containing protein n=1 Tax=Mycolicibacterium gilvum (strain PYR-GCK) TaxID=350054 RepID=A4T508_MYCGI|nr:PPE domain-containing protein [Mycolicibacterium sp. PAM1]ABP43242.1 conserved hypothetical protein [Mycolicibacterium gilvum PYR-GCK]MBV5246505.1 PPE domain-containing protein [Mycolicibacterium sp. PAM1]